jgi:aminopeptidase N
LIWASFWDATRDGDLPASAYVETTLGAIAAETSSTTRQTLLGQLQTALAFYVAPARRAALTAAVADRLWALVEAAKAGSDAQLQFFKSVTALAQQPATLDRLAAAWRGEAVPDGLTLDTDLRWEVLTALAAGDVVDEAEIAAELERDPTTRGRESAARARAARTTPQAKWSAWNAIVNDRTITNATQRALIAGFTRVLDRGLLTGFVEPYFAALEQVWVTRSREMATNVVEGLYPSLSLNDVDVVQATDRWLAQLGERQPALRRLATERRATVVRALRAQAVDGLV